MTTTQAPPDAPAYPSWWSFKEEGASIAGAFVRADSGFTKNGERPFVVLDVDGTERTVWLHHDVLRSAFAIEVRRRPDKQIHVGERIEIHQLGEKESENNPGRSYVNYRVVFADSPPSSQADVFGSPPETATEPESKPESSGGGGSSAGDDIPFQ